MLLPAAGNDLVTMIVNAKTGPGEALQAAVGSRMLLHRECILGGQAELGARPAAIGAAEQIVAHIAIATVKHVADHEAVVRAADEFEPDAPAESPVDHRRFPCATSAAVWT